MRRTFPTLAACAGALAALAGCGGSGSPDQGVGGAAPLTSYIGTTGVFAAWADPGNGQLGVAAAGSFAGKRQSLRGTTDFLTGKALSQPAGVEIYKSADGHIHALDLTSSAAPVPVQISAESAATVDDTCSFTGTSVAAADYDYAGVYFAADPVTPVHSTYVYRLPGPDGVCNSADDVFHMVRTGMSPQDAPVAVPGMPVATVHSAQGAITGFVLKSGASLVLTDDQFSNPVVLGTFPAPINVAVALPVGTVQGYPGGQLYVVDGNIVFVDYAGRTVSPVLCSIPGWSPTSAQALFAASPTTLYMAINTAATMTTPATATIYAIAADGSAPPNAVDTEPGRIETLVVPVQSSSLVWGIANPNYTIRAFSGPGGTASTLVSSSTNGGSFIATATSVYYTTWEGSTDAANHIVTRSGTQSGIVSLTGSVLQPPLAASTFLNGGEQFPWPEDTTTTQVAYATVIQVRGLAPVSVTSAATGWQYIADGVAGGSLVAIDTASNQPVATLGTLPTGTAAYLNGSFRGNGHWGFIEATNALSTQNAQTRDLYLLNTQTSNSLVRATGNL